MSVFDVTGEDRLRWQKERRDKLVQAIKDSDDGLDLLNILSIQIHDMNFIAIAALCDVVMRQKKQIKEMMHEFPLFIKNE